MTNKRTYCFLLFLCVLCVFSACRSFDKRLTLWRNDKIPYGTYYAYHSLDDFFKNAAIRQTRQAPQNLLYYSTSSDEKLTPAAYIVIGKTIAPSGDELQAILNHAAVGNYVFLSGLNLGPNLLDSFRLKVSSQNFGDSLTVSLIHPETGDPVVFKYPGYSLDRHFVAFDSSITNILGEDGEGNPNFVSFTYKGGGAIFIHLAPTVFSNFFLLHKQNKAYYDLAMSHLPGSITKVNWDDYFRHHFNGKEDDANKGFSKLRLFLFNPVLKWAFWLTILLIGIVYLFESKRKQRVLPYLKPVKNTSLDFVETIGRLYYQQKDNKNLFSKITAQFMGHIRHRYKLSASEPDEEMEKTLAYKSGYDAAEIKNIFEHLRRLEQRPSITDDEILDFNNKIDAFYKQT